MSKLRIGIIGLGEQSQNNLIPCLLMSEYSTIVSACDINPAVLTKVCDQYSIANRFTDYWEMITQMDHDAIIVASTPAVHYDALQLCIKHGVHVFVEKPPVSNLTELSHINDLIKSSQKKVKTGVGMNFSYTFANKIIQEHLESSSSNLVNISVDHLSSKPDFPFWNCDTILTSFLLAQLIHPLDYVIRLGGKVTSVNIEASKDDTPIFIQLTLKFDSGCIGSIRCGTCSPNFQHRVQLLMSDKTLIEVDNLKTININTLDEKPYLSGHSKRVSYQHTHSPIANGLDIAGYQDLLDSFFRSIIFSDPFDHTIESMHVVYSIFQKIENEISHHYVKSVTHEQHS